MMAANSSRDFSSLRVALFSGILGSVGATVGWLLWIAIQAVHRDWKVLLAPVVGAALGYAIHWVEHYIHTARHEREHGPEEKPQHEPAPHEPAPQAPTPAPTVRVWILALGFLALACEHLVGHLMSEFLLPFLASLATLFPAGALFGLALSGGRDEQHPLSVLLMGALMGGAAALLALLVQSLMGAKLRWDALFGWWVLVGLGLAICCPTKNAPGPFHTVAGVCVSLVLVVICSVPGVTRFLEKTPAYLSFPTLAIASAVDGSLRSPDVPAVFWIEAEARAHAAEHEGHGEEPKGEPRREDGGGAEHGGSHEEHSANPFPANLLRAQMGPDGGGASQNAPPDSGSGIGAGSGGSSPSISNGGGSGAGSGPSGGFSGFGQNAPWRFQAPDGGVSPLGKGEGSGLFSNAPSGGENQAPLLGNEPLSPGNGPTGYGLGNGPSGGLGTAPSPQELNEILRRNQELFKRDPLQGLHYSDPDYLKRMLEQASDPALERQRILQQELKKGMASGLIRSWIVLLLFAVGIGLGPVVEATLRPRGEYEKSETRRNDAVLASSVVILILAACVVVRIGH